MPIFASHIIDKMILVTGGTGLVGSYLLFDLLKQGKKVRALRRANSKLDIVERTFRNEPGLLNRIEWTEGDVNDLYSLSESLVDVTEVYHAAGLVSFKPGEFVKLIKVNTEGTANLVNLALESGVKRFCYFSSVAALGRIESGTTLNEDSLWKTSKKNSNYAISKYGGEREVWRGIEEGLHAVILNPSIILGAGDWDSGSSRLISQVWKGLLFYTEGITGFVDVRDVSHVAISLMEKEIFGQRFILNSENWSYHQVFDQIAECLGRKKPSILASHIITELAWRVESVRSIFTHDRTMITRETVRNSHDQWFYSNEKIKKELGMEFIPVKQSISDLCRIFLEEFGRNQKVIS